MHTPVNFFPDKHYFKRPAELPAGFLEIIQPLAEWMMRQLVAAYDDGYSAGRMDAARLEVMKRTAPKS
jgi:hypothetical protein